LAAAALIAAALTLAGCGSSDDSTQSSSAGLPKEIVIGAAIGKTGYMAPYDVSIAAVQQMVDETNADGGIDGHKLRIVEADTRSDPQQAPVAAQKVIEDGADVLYYSAEAFTAAAGAPIAEENNKLNLSVADEPGYGPPTTGRLSFSSNPSLLSEASAGASFLHGRGVEHPFLFRDTSLIYGKAYCSAFQQTWEHLGGTIAGSADFKNEDESIASQIGELKGSDADAVLMCSYPPGGAAAIKQIRGAEVTLPILGPSAFDGTVWLKGISDTDDIYATSNGSIYDPPDRSTARLLRRLKGAGIDTDYSTNLLAAYAAAQLIVDAIKETGSVEGNTLADALEAKPHRTILGKFSYTREDHFPSRVWPVYVFSGGKEQLVAKVKPQFAPQYGG
jgi:branched-chain amino acid transport system substrate-binding protein